MNIVSWKIRLYNLFIDIFAIIFLNIILLWFGMFIELLAKEYLSINLIFGGNYFILISFFIYYFILEYFLGKTIGKFITKCIVLNKEGEKPNFKQILFRTITRFIIIEFVSFFQKEPLGWHDRLSSTYVVYDDKT